QCRTGRPLFRGERDEWVLPLGSATGDFLEARDAAGFDRAENGALDERFVARAARDEHGVVPGVTNLFLCRTGCALNNFGRIAVDGGGEMFGKPGLRRARLADE